jgi:uncharacterized Zn ribbon protein
MEAITKTKITKAENFATLRQIVLDTVTDQEEQDALIEFIDNEVAILEKRKADAAKRAEKKKAESDELTEEIFDLLGEELTTVDEVVVALDNEEITRAMVTARLGKLVREGRIVKEDVKVDGKKRKAYRVAGEEADAE